MGKQRSDRVTLSDVAMRAGVAPSTVSYILRRVEPHFSRYSPLTIERVRKTAEEIGYAPNILASSLRQQQLPFFGVFFEFVRPGDRGPGGGQSAILWEICEGIASAAQEHRRYPIVLSSPDPQSPLAGSPEELDRIVRTGLSGVIAAVHPTTWQSHLVRWEEAGVPCISLFDHGTADRPRWYVDLDNDAVGRLAREYLSRQGHRRILCVHQTEPAQPVADRLTSFTEWAGGSEFLVWVLQLDRCLGKSSQLAPAMEDRVAQAIDEHAPTAVFTLDGGSSVLVSEALAGRNIRVPEEISQIGIDIPIWSSAAHSVTQITCPGIEIGRAAAAMLARRIEDGDGEPHYGLVRPGLNDRGSVLNIRGCDEPGPW